MTPYDGFKAEIKFDAKSFSITDNCGGIPWDNRNYAFRMGRPHGSDSGVPGSVGVYGIGMKRAIFKIGKYCSIFTRNGNDQYEIEIPPDWVGKENEWDIPITKYDPITGGGSRGTRIMVSH